MNFSQVVRARRMVRSFRDEPVPPESLQRILEHANTAPSAGFTQGSAFLALVGPEETGRFFAATFDDATRARFAWPGLFAAPAIVVALAHEQAYHDRYAEPDKGVTDPQEFWPVPYWYVDTAFAAMLMLLTAVDEGLGALFFGIFPGRLDAFRSAFGVPEAFAPIGALAIGYPAGDDRPSSSTRRGRTPLELVVHRGRWRR